MRHKILFIIVLLLHIWSAKADEAVRFTASAPATVVLDRPFQLVYSINASGKDLRMPEITNFDVLAGPFESHSSSIQITNGRQTSSMSISYTYTLQAQKTGSFSIPSASIIVGGQKYTSNGVTIKVLPADAQASSRSQNSQTQSNAQAISGDNIFIRTEVSKSNVYEQEPILVSYKLYTLVDVVQCQPKKMIDFNGFMKQDIELPRNKQSTLENINGRNYITVLLYQCLLYPQRTGALQIDKWDFDAVVQVRNRATTRSIFDDFFDSYSNVNKHLTAPSAKVIVNALPANKPASFTGTVGRFSINSNLSANQVKANDAVTLKISISGAGNMKMITNPTLKLPDGFEIYDPKVSNNFKTSPSGVSGSKNIEYMFIPRHSGSFEIPATEFSYFDTQDKSYKTLRTPAYKLEVAKGEGTENNTIVGNYVSKEDVKQLGKDIRFIYTDKIELSNESTPLFGSVLAWLMYLIPLIISIIMFIIFRKQAIENANVVLVKNKKANKIAQKRLKFAQKLLYEGKKDNFYEEVLKALWTYLSDKLSIPAASLTKDSIVSELTKRGVETELIDGIIQIMSTCEFARYAPNTGQQEMGNLYSDTVKAISQLEESVKRP